MNFDSIDIVLGECTSPSKFEIAQSLYSSLPFFKDIVLSTSKKINQFTGILNNYLVLCFLCYRSGISIAMSLWLEKGLPTTASHVQQALCTFTLEYPILSI
jgi:hypothetical protein